MKDKMKPSIKRYTVEEIIVLASTMGMPVSSNAGKPVIKQCVGCGKKVTKRYYTLCDSCHLTK